jgi:DNA-binding GntR family transcriptional regulator
MARKPTPSPPSSAHQQAYAYIREQVQAGRLAGGARVKPEEVANVLGISRMPVREAIRQLDTEGLLTIRPNRGAIVTVLSADRLLELFEMRAVLEGLCARSAAKLFDEDAFDELGLLLVRMDRVANDSDLWIQRHESFHDFICQNSGRPFVAAEVRKLRAAVEPYLRMSRMSAEASADSSRQHREIVDALLTGDGATAERVMRAHIDSTVGDVMRTIPETRLG